MDANYVLDLFAPARYATMARFPLVFSVFDDGAFTSREDRKHRIAVAHARNTQFHASRPWLPAAVRAPDGAYSSATASDTGISILFAALRSPDPALRSCPTALSRLARPADPALHCRLACALAWPALCRISLEFWRTARRCQAVFFSDSLFLLLHGGTDATNVHLLHRRIVAAENRGG